MLDGWGAYDYKDFAIFCRQQEIKRHLTTKCILQENGVDEIKNQPIMNISMSMIKDKNLSNDFWDEVVPCSDYILNISPKKCVKYKLPQEPWSGRKSIVSHLKFFCFISYAHVPKNLRRKHDNMSEKYIFIGYNEHSKAYRLYNRVTKKFVVRSDVKFLEWPRKWNNGQPKPIASNRWTGGQLKIKSTSTNTSKVTYEKTTRIAWK